MGPETTCPICRLEHIPQDRETCPQCDADLTCFKALDALAGAAAAVPTSPSGTGEKRLLLPILAACVAVLAVAGMGLSWYRIRIIESRLETQGSALHQTIETVMPRLDQILAGQDRIVSLAMEHTENRPTSPLGPPPSAEGIESPSTEPSATNNSVDTPSSPEPLPPNDRLVSPSPESIPPAGSPNAPVETTGARPSVPETPAETTPPKPSTSPPNRDAGEDTAFHTYPATDTDTLWGIARRFYGTGHLYPVLLAHNPDLSVYDIGAKDRIKILKDRKAAKALYRTITRLEGRRLFWLYTARPGDTPAAIQARYCPERACLPPALDMDENGQIYPGTRIEIALAGAF